MHPALSLPKSILRFALHVAMWLYIALQWALDYARGIVFNSSATATTDVPTNNSFGNSSADLIKPTTESPRLLKIPREVRNKIYALVFEITKTASGYIDSAGPHPSLDSIMACRQLYTEYKSMYLHAYRGYWRNGLMHIYLRRGQRIKKAAENLSDPKVAIRRIRYFLVKGKNAGGGTFAFRLFFSLSNWYYSAFLEEPTDPRLIRLPVMRDTVAFLQEHEMEGELGDPSQDHGMTVSTLVDIIKIHQKATLAFGKRRKTLAGIGGRFFACVKDLGTEYLLRKPIVVVWKTG